MAELNPYLGIDHKILADRLYEAEAEVIRLRLKLSEMQEADQAAKVEKVNPDITSGSKERKRKV